MNLKEFKTIINKIPKEYDNVEVSFLTNSVAWYVQDIDDIEWYESDIEYAMDGSGKGKKYIDISLS